MDDPDNSPARALIIRGGALGDFLLTAPALRMLREGLPGLEIELLGYEPMISLAVAGGLADTARSIDYAGLAPFFADRAKADPTLEPALCDYFSGFNLIVSYLYDPDGYFAENLRAAGAKHLITSPHRIDEAADLHAALQLAAPLETLALYPEPRHLEGTSLTLAPDSELPSPTLCLHPGSGGEAKNWPVQNWAELARRLLADRPGCRLLLVTGPAEAERGQTAAGLDALSDVDFDHLDCAPLPELAARLSQVDLYLGHDSGVSHLAAAAGAPCHLIFGPTDPAIWAPPSARVTLTQAPEGDLAALTPDRLYEDVPLP